MAEDVGTKCAKIKSLMLLPIDLKAGNAPRIVKLMERRGTRESKLVNVNAAAIGSNLSV